MNRESIHQKIDELLSLLSIHNSRLSLHSEKLSQLDIDVLRKQCIDLYDQVNLLALQGKIKKPETKPQAIEDPVATPVAPPKVQQREVVLSKPRKEVPAPKPEPVVEVLAPEPIVVEVPEPIAVKPVAKNTPKKKIAEPKGEDEMLSLFEKFSSNPIDSIPKSISLVKRFEFQSVFFDGEPKEYNAFMASLDGAGDREGAFEVYHKYKNDLNWDHEELKDELKALIYRKYT